MLRKLKIVHSKGYDLIRLDMAVLPEVAEELFVPLEEIEAVRNS